MEKYIVTVSDDRITWTNEAGQLHRLDGPAITKGNGTEFWYQNGKLHRLDGPAIKRRGGCCDYYIQGVFYTEQQFVDRNKQFTTEEKTLKSLADKLGYKLEKLPAK